MYEVGLNEIKHQSRYGTLNFYKNNFLCQWFADHLKKSVVREGQNIDLYKDSRTTSANLTDHHWSVEQTLGITVLCTWRILHSIYVHILFWPSFERDRLLKVVSSILCIVTNIWVTKLLIQCLLPVHFVIIILTLQNSSLIWIGRRDKFNVNLYMLIEQKAYFLKKTWKQGSSITLLPFSCKWRNNKKSILTRKDVLLLRELQ